MLPIQPLLGIIGYASLAIAAGYTVLALVAVLVWNVRRTTEAPLELPPVTVTTEAPLELPAVTVLKPLCGAEPGLYENLRSFCQQDYPQYQIVFGVRDPADPALEVVERLIHEFPALALDVVVDPLEHGTNNKISSLLNMLTRARYDVLAMADSDAFVGPDYLRTVAAPLLDPTVGLVTCIYHGIPTEPIWSRLGAMYVNEWYMPSVLLAWLFGHQGYVSGQTLCLRRETLQAIGGLRAIANHLADDYQMGELVRGLGLRVVLSPYLPKAEHHEPTLHLLSRHELRWMRTLRVLRPRSFRLIFLTFSLPLAVFGIALAAVEPAFSTAAWTLFQTTVVARLALHFVHRLRGDRPLLADFWLLPARDLLICWVWARSFFGTRITWRGSEFDVDTDGIMHRLS
jgi:ceramide glucosyltransferase